MAWWCGVDVLVGVEAKFFCVTFFLHTARLRPCHQGRREMRKLNVPNVFVMTF